MAYTPTEWETADIVTATRMNALETAVGEMNMSYTPNTWSDGDILTAAKMNALEQAVASGGGGGSSDFSTAQVTITNNSATPIQASLPISVDIEEDEWYTTQGDIYIDNGTNTFNAILYKGLCSAYIPSGGISISISGDIEDDGGGYYLIAGDCTIIIS